MIENPRQGIRKNVSRPGGRNTSRINNTAATKQASKKKPRKPYIEVTVYKSEVDRIFLLLVISLLCMGTVMIFSASYANALEFFGDSYYFAKKQIIFALFGIAVMIAASYFAKYTILEKWTVLFFAGVLILNYLTPFIGKVTNGAPRWFPLPFIGTVQPSELLKLAVVLLFAFYITRIGDKMKTFVWGIGVPGIIIISIIGAMYLQSHFSGLIIIAAICAFIIFIGEAPIKWLVGFAATGAIGVAGIINFTEYASSRVQMWQDPFQDPSGAGYQIIQSLYAIGSGGLTGLGWGQSRQKYLYLPEPQNDFIFSIICEEMGFVGALLIISLFIVLIWRGFVIAYHAPNKFSSLVVMGIIIKVAIQFLLNIAVVTNTVPNTGISLPFFSYGGTALIVLMFEMGIILSISRYSYEEKP